MRGKSKYMYKGIDKYLPFSYLLTETVNVNIQLEIGRAKVKSKWEKVKACFKV